LAQPTALVGSGCGRPVDKARGATRQACIGPRQGGGRAL